MRIRVSGDLKTGGVEIGILRVVHIPLQAVLQTAWRLLPFACPSVPEGDWTRPGPGRLQPFLVMRVAQEMSKICRFPKRRGLPVSEPPAHIRTQTISGSLDLYYVDGDRTLLSRSET